MTDDDKTPCAKILDHKFLDPVCVEIGCQSLVLTNALRKLTLMARTSGGTAGPDAALMQACEVAEAALGIRTLSDVPPADMVERVAMALGEKCLELRGHGLSFANEYARAAIAAMTLP